MGMTQREAEIDKGRRITIWHTAVNDCDKAGFELERQSAGPHVTVKLFDKKRTADTPPIREWLDGQHNHPSDELIADLSLLMRFGLDRHGT